MKGKGEKDERERNGREGRMQLNNGKISYQLRTVQINYSDIESSKILANLNTFVDGYLL